MHKNAGRTAGGPGTVVPPRPDSPDWQAFEEMFLVSRSKFISMAYGILRNREDAEDAVQDAMLSAYLHLRGFEGRSAIRTWFTRVVLNASLMIRRRRKPAHIEFVPESAGADDTRRMDIIPASKPDPEVRCAQTETLELIDALIGKLNPTLRQAFTMTYFDEIPAKKAGALLGVTTGTFKSRLFRAKKHLINLAQRSVLAPIQRVMPFPLCGCKTDFQDLPANSAEIWSREMAF